MKRRRLPCEPDVADLRRLRDARREARATVAEADARYAGERRAAFRLELAATVRFASPFLERLLALEGLTLGDVAARIEPLPGWPSVPRLSQIFYSRNYVGHASKATVVARKYGFPVARRPDLHGISIPLDGGGLAYVQIVGHSLEVRATIGALIFETRFGELHITTTEAVPVALAAAAVGRAVDDLVSHPATNGRGWQVKAAETTFQKTMFTVETGSVRWRLDGF